MCRKRSSKTEKETQFKELIMLVNPSKIYVNINNNAVILLLMAIYNKNQATVSQNHTKDCSRLSNEDGDMLFTGT